ncbi:hypothetical protein P3X46_000140 [Hevea brasiliensis]|uniref:C2H2-type domain-containing protein n=1 Tax=Hevea brasiliensis TaxID=3981 RepID=A0ABQ9N8D4_HEVBR|nr:zinc finger protein ZAT5 [Hevea brasiliensis]KAJ9188776.1 hypothetical protein P3X46_000140 [Hevea brasiliensis]
MDMEAQEEFMGSNDLSQIVKGKRTKRLRSSSSAGMSSSSCSGCGGSGGGGGGETGLVVEEHGSISSPTSCSEIYESTEEEEDMANCLILLAQGDGPRQQLMNDENNSRMENLGARKFPDASTNTTTTTTNKAGFYVYECKTCNRSFPSFQALGGHRASHKKPKSIVVEEKKATLLVSPLLDDLEDCQLNKSSNSTSPDHLQQPLSLHISNKGGSFLGNNKTKIHECSICGSEFTSGQALGGHMRRHRANTANNNNQVVITTTTNTDSSSEDQIKPRNILPLDLNLPAPEDDHHSHRESKFQFASAQQALVFSAPALVDCHY